MKYFITGGAGFIGSNFVNLLFDTQEDLEKVTVFDKFTYAANIKNISDHEKNPIFTVIKGDITDSDLLTKAMNGHEVVIHFAAESHVDRSISSAAEFINSNVLGTLNVLEAVRTNKVKTMIHVSTDEVYGSISEGAATEEYPLLPNSPYAASKASSDLIARSFYKTHGVDVRITRCCNNYGKYQYPEKVIPVIINSILNNKKIPIYGDGSNIREWIHVDDHCKAILEVLKSGSPGEIYNIGSGQYFTNLELAKNICGAMGATEELITYVEDRLGHDFRYSIDSLKLDKIIMMNYWQYNQGFNQVIEWYKNNQEWWN